MTPTQARLTPNLIPFGCPKKLFIALFLSPAFYGFLFAALLPTIRLTCKIYIFWCRRVNSLTRRQLTTLFPRPTTATANGNCLPQLRWWRWSPVWGSGRLLTDAGFVCISGGVMASHSAGEWERALI